MAILTFNRYVGIGARQDVMDRVFEDTLVRPDPLRPVNGRNLALPLDVSESADEFVVKAQIPGTNLEDVGISVKDRSLTITVGESVEGEDQGAEEIFNWHYRELYHGARSRTIAMPSGLNTAKAEANFANGLLIITVPKTEEVKPRQIKVNALSSGKK